MYKLPRLSFYNSASQKYSFGKANPKSVLEEGLSEYENGYKHRLSAHSEINLKQYGFVKFERQLGRNLIIKNTKKTCKFWHKIVMSLKNQLSAINHFCFIIHTSINSHKIYFY